MALFPRIDWEALESMMRPARQLLLEDLTSLQCLPPDARLRLWEEMQSLDQGLRACQPAPPEEVAARCRQEVLLARLLVAASLSRAGRSYPGVTDQFTPAEIDLAIRLDSFKALDALDPEDLERMLHRGDSHPVLQRLAESQYSGLYDVLVSADVRKGLVSAVKAVYHARIEMLETAVVAYQAFLVEKQGADGVLQATEERPPSAPEIAIYGGHVEIKEVNVDKPEFHVHRQAGGSKDTGEKGRGS